MCGEGGEEGAGGGGLGEGEGGVGRGEVGGRVSGGRGGGVGGSDGDGVGGGGGDATEVREGGDAGKGEHLDIMTHIQLGPIPIFPSDQ